MTDLDNGLSPLEDDDDGIVELTDIVEEGPALELEEDIVELTDIVEQPDKESVLELEDAVPAVGGGEEIVELDDIVMAPEAGLELNAPPDIGVDISDDALIDEPVMDEAPGLVPEMETDETDLTDFSVAPAVETDIDNHQIKVSSTEIEAALERIIENKFADQFDEMLTSAMQKVVQEQINQVKERLKQALDQM